MLFVFILLYPSISFITIARMFRIMSGTEMRTNVNWHIEYDLFNDCFAWKCLLTFCNSPNASNEMKNLSFCCWFAKTLSCTVCSPADWCETRWKEKKIQTKRHKYPVAMVGIMNFEISYYPYKLNYLWLKIALHAKCKWHSGTTSTLQSMTTE